MLAPFLAILPVGEVKSSISYCSFMFCVYLRCLGGFRLLGEPALPHDIAGRRRSNLSILGHLSGPGRSACLSQHVLAGRLKRQWADDRYSANSCEQKRQELGGDKFTFIDLDY